MSAAFVVAATIAALLFAGWRLAAGGGAMAGTRRLRTGAAAVPSRRRRRPARGGLWPGRAGTGPAEEFQHAAILVGQLAALLRAGRTPEQMWRQASEAYPAGERESADPAPRVLRSAAMAADLGRPVAAAIRTAVSEREPPPHRSTGAAAGIWLSVAACIEAAEASGSALADVLERLAAQLEADADAVAARSVALAGPRATAKVLSILPVAGLGLGMLMGADPFGVLVSTPLGAMCLGLGAALTVAGRWWSTRLVRSASEAR
ncbi:type II secretion system F family protein [Sinomonas atrocyanea]